MSAVTAGDDREARRAFGTREAEERALVEGLRHGDEAAFTTLLGRYQSSLVRLALMYVPNRQAAEDAVQDTWMGVVQGIDRFEGRSSLRTWLFRILLNRAKAKGVAERRHVPASSLDGAEAHGDAVDPSRFFDHSSRWAGHWSAPPQSWDGIPEDRLLGKEVRAIVEEVVAGLPQAQREVITLRDIRGLSAVEVCAVLDLSEANQRVLLHRARTKVRARLEAYLTPTERSHP